MRKLLLLFFPILLWASYTSINTDNVTLFQNTYILNENVTIEEAIKNQNFYKPANLSVTLHNKFSRNFWIKIPIKNALNETLNKTLLLFWKNIDLSIYYKNGASLTGPFDKSDVEDSAMVIDHFKLNAYEEKEIYIKVNEHPYLDDFTSIKIVNESSYLSTIRHTERLYDDSFFYGVLLTMLFAGLILYASTELKSYLYYVLFLFSILCITSNFKWFIFPYFTGDMKHFLFILNRVFSVTLATIALSLFTQEFFELKKYHPYINRFVQFYIGFTLLCALYKIVTTGDSMPPSYPILLLPSFVIIGLILYKSHGVSALFYAVSIFIFILPMFLQGLMRNFQIEVYQDLFANLQISGTVASIILSFATLIKLKEIIQERQNLEKQVYAKSRFAAMGEIVANIAHQWRQPLNHLSSLHVNIQMLHKMDKLSPDQCKANSDEAALQIKHMSDTIDDFMNFFSQKKQEFTFMLSEIIGDALKFINVSFSNNHIHVDIKLTKDSEVTTYKNELLQVLIIILSNAKDALKEMPEDNRKITIEIDEAKISITDNAGGIDPSIIDKVFEPYFTTKESKNGTGLGLYTAKTIIENNIGGKIQVENVREGAKFILEIPK